MDRGRKKGILLIFIGIALIAAPIFLHLYDAYRSGQYMKEVEDVTDEEEKDEEAANSKKKEALPAEGAVGIVEIESLDIRYPVFEGAGDVQLNRGIGHVVGTADLCGVGNCVLAGHNGSRRGTFFTYLCNIRIGAEVKVTNKDGVTHAYEVKSTEVVGPYDGTVTQESDVECLTLFTCASHGTQRFVCRCDRKGGDAAGQQEHDE